MYQKERLERILDFLNRNGFATVKELTELLHYSTATVNRDLNALEQMKKIKRSYGGAEPVKDKSVPLPFRYEKMKAAKKRIGKAAAALIEDGDTVFLVSDGAAPLENYDHLINIIKSTSDEDTPEELCNRVVELTKKNSKDDVSCVAVKIKGIR